MVIIAGRPTTSARGLAGSAQPGGLGTGRRGGSGDMYNRAPPHTGRVAAPPL